MDRRIEADAAGRKPEFLKEQAQTAKPKGTLLNMTG